MERSRPVVGGLGFATALAAMVLLTGCAVLGPPLVPVTQRTTPPPGQALRILAGSGIHIVKRGDTVYGISRRYGLPVRAVIDANGLGPPYLLEIGRRLVIPETLEHLVQRGDTLYGISRHYGISMSDVARANGIKPPYTIVVGQRLRLPLSAPGLALAAAPNPAAPSIRADRQPSQPSKTERLVAIPTPPPLSNDTFLWPVKGKIISSFGPKKNGFHNDGINISAPRGTPVVAAANGVVVYAGNELRGFGNLLLIKHADGWITAYAHNETLLVKRGDLVRRGQIISRVGSTGNVAEAQLHFEIRRGRRAVNPLDQMVQIGRPTQAVAKA